ncbi:hypothetical protein SAMN04487944_13211 [Gracilibacillus ureilyticus]|uniref:Uncharacterized protein n=1 Tax=Gracilibacillus ureilyticus TaxID=531814 RepID=A0A1H9W1Q2_9BACI|nr:hypothetical protein SAMN04487944_13211 [Gracilibacillus ureilyticus]
MTLAVLISTIIALIFSTICCSWINNIQNNKWLSLSIAFIVNMFILCTAAIIFYITDVQQFHKQPDGIFQSLGILVFPFCIPIVTLINFFILDIKRYRR